MYSIRADHAGCAGGANAGAPGALAFGGQGGRHGAPEGAGGAGLPELMLGGGASGGAAAAPRRRHGPRRVRVRPRGPAREPGWVPAARLSARSPAPEGLAVLRALSLAAMLRTPMTETSTGPLTSFRSNDSKLSIDYRSCMDTFLILLIDFVHSSARSCRW